MPAESLFSPIRTDAIRQARARLASEGLSVEQWARREGFAAKTVYNVLSGKRPAIRGVSLKIALKLGLRQRADLEPPQDALSPAGRTEGPAPAGPIVGDGAPVSDWNRRPKFQVGEPVR